MKTFPAKFFNWIKSVLKCFRGRSVGTSKSARLGKKGEGLAANFLKRKGFKLLTRNWIGGGGEIDIVAIDKKAKNLVFVEVKLRSASSAIPGYFAVNKKKRNLLRKACKAYLWKFTNMNLSFRFDIVEIEIGSVRGKQRICHYENVKLF